MHVIDKTPTEDGEELIALLPLLVHRPIQTLEGWQWGGEARQASLGAMSTAAKVSSDRIEAIYATGQHHLDAIVADEMSGRAFVRDIFRQTALLVAAVLCLLFGIFMLVAGWGVVGQEGTAVKVMGGFVALLGLISAAGAVHGLSSWLRRSHGSQLEYRMVQAMDSIIGVGDKAVYVAWDSNVDGFARAGLIAYEDLGGIDQHVDGKAVRRLSFRGNGNADLDLDCPALLDAADVDDLISRVRKRAPGIRLR